MLYLCLTTIVLLSFPTKVALCCSIPPTVLLCCYSFLLTVILSHYTSFLLHFFLTVLRSCYTASFLLRGSSPR